MRNPDSFPTSWPFVRAENGTIVSRYLSMRYSGCNSIRGLWFDSLYTSHYLRDERRDPRPERRNLLGIILPEIETIVSRYLSMRYSGLKNSGLANWWIS